MSANDEIRLDAIEKRMDKYDEILEQLDDHGDKLRETVVRLDERTAMIASKLDERTAAIEKRMDKYDEILDELRCNVTKLSTRGGVNYYWIMAILAIFCAVAGGLASHLIR